MTAKIRCFVGSWRTAVDPDNKFSFGGKSVPKHFAQASSLTADGRPDVDLKLDLSRLSLGLNTNNPHERAEAYWLAEGLKQLLRPGGESPRPDVVGVILTDYYHPKPTIFGAMFTPAFKSGILPRSGAAVFVNRIRDCRPDERDFSEQLTYTIIHELGHLFNLWHIENSKNLMKSSDKNATYPPNTTFRSVHRKWLSVCSAEPNVHPGKTHFEDYGTLRTTIGPDIMDAPRRRVPVRLELTAPQPEFHAFEPMEIDVAVRLQGPDHKKLEIPDEIDPGYDGFAIWITEPGGARRRYRPTERYCRNDASVVLTRTRPFKRDIAIFGGAGGYTFRKAGTHVIEAVLALPNLPSIRSNSIEVYVKPPAPRSAAYRDLDEVLTLPEVASLLYYRAGATRSPAIGHLTELCARRQGTAAAANAHYALGRMFAKQAAVLRRGDVRRNRIKLAESHLRAAARSRCLCGHRAERTHELLESGIAFAADR
jgi:hypothetical protein